MIAVCTRCGAVVAWPRGVKLRAPPPSGERLARWMCPRPCFGALRPYAPSDAARQDPEPRRGHLRLVRGPGDGAPRTRGPRRANWKKILRAVRARDPRQGELPGIVLDFPDPPPKTMTSPIPTDRSPTTP